MPFRHSSKFETRAYTRTMGFYYGSNQPDDEPPGGFRETVAIIIAVFRVLALPVGILFGGVLAIGFLFFLFTLSRWLGLGAIGLIVLALVARGIWEARHPPELL